VENAIARAKRHGDRAELRRLRLRRRQLPRAAGYVGDAVGVGGDVLEGGPALVSRGVLVNCV
jgi:hypothetical protein